MKIALISDELTRNALHKEAEVKCITPRNYKFILHFWKPDILFVESAWHGYKNKWKFKIASYPGYPKRNNHKLQQVVKYAKKLAIPTVFWNKEDSVHFDRFIDSAKLFDHIFTVDENCINKYREIVDDIVTVNTLLFAVQSQIHNFTGFNFKYNKANFVGSYSHHIHNRRRAWQDMIFSSALNANLQLTIFDRNSERKSKNYRYPLLDNIEIKPSVPYDETAQIYKDYLISLNVNTIEDSTTMFSRRLVEIIACGGIAISNPSPAVERYFKKYCYIVSNKGEAESLFKRLKNGASKEDLRRAKAGATYVAKEHTWTHRLEEIADIVGLNK
ncbi:MAG TPA: glycosyltransferase family 1 protein [Saprospiraceae bacterium]|nr:glycosyltransferase family 1 protein [Saprospiraceae bacterium]